MVGTLEAKETNASAGNPRWWNITWLWFGLVSYCLALASLPIALRIAPACVFLLGAAGPRLLYGWAWKIDRKGDPENALRLIRLGAWLPWNGSLHSMEGYLLASAGRFKEAQVKLKPLAFDKAGQPRLTRYEFAAYAYAVGSGSQGDEAAAETLLEQAVNVPQQVAAFHVGLADFLLAQKKDAERSEQLMRYVLETWPQPGPPGTQNIAMHGFTLARCGRRQEAEAQLEIALRDSTTCARREKAVLQHIAGLTYQALGERDKAQIAFEQALEIQPGGAIALLVRKSMDKFGMRV